MSEQSQCAAPSAVRFEHHTTVGSVLGIGTAEPRLSWTVPQADADYRQSAYELEVARDGAAPESYIVASDAQVLVAWPGHPLVSRESATVRVRVRGTAGWGEWSPSATVVAGLLDPADWSARFVSPVSHGGVDSPAPLLRTCYAPRSTSRPAPAPPRSTRPRTAYTRCG